MENAFATLSLPCYSGVNWGRPGNKAGRNVGGRYKKQCEATHKHECVGTGGGELC